MASTFLAWPFIVFVTAVITTAMHGAEARRDSGRGILAQLADEIRLAVTDGILPPWYFIFELHDSRRRNNASAYIQRFEIKGGLYRILRQYAKVTIGKPMFTLTDKVAFFNACRAGDLPTPTIYFEARDGEISWLDGANCLPSKDLFAKPVGENGGAGAERWHYVGNGRWRDRDGTEQDEHGLLERFRRLSEGWPMLVQARLLNHAAISDLSCGALATVRMLSIWNEDRRPELTNAVFRMPARDGSLVDNFHAGGIAAAIDMRIGTLGPATNLGLTERMHWHDVHPVTGAPITGFRLPNWPEVLDFCVKAHSVFSQYPLIGFDVAILEDGPALVEGNVAPDLDLIQRPHRAPLGDTRFGELFARHLDMVTEWEQQGSGGVPAA